MVVSLTPDAAAVAWLNHPDGLPFVSMLTELASQTAHVIARTAMQRLFPQGTNLTRDASEMLALVATMVEDPDLHDLMNERTGALATSPVFRATQRGVGLDLTQEDHAKALALRAWHLRVCALARGLVATARSLHSTSVDAVTWIEARIDALLPAEEWPEAARAGARAFVLAEVVRDPRPWTADDLRRVERVCESIDDQMGWAPTAPLLRQFAPDGADEERVVRALDAESQTRARESLEAIVPAAPAKPGALATATEAGVERLMEDLLGVGNRSGRPLRSILKAHRDDAARRARSADPSQDPRELDRQRKRRERTGSAAPDPSRVRSAPVPADPAVSAEARDVVNRVKAGLSPEEWAAIELESAGASDREIGRRLGVSRKTARARVNSALEKALKLAR